MQNVNTMVKEAQRKPKPSHLKYVTIQWKLDGESTEKYDSDQESKLKKKAESVQNMVETFMNPARKDGQVESDELYF